MGEDSEVPKVNHWKPTRGHLGLSGHDSTNHKCMLT